MHASSVVGNVIARVRPEACEIDFEHDTVVMAKTQELTGACIRMPLNASCIYRRQYPQAY